MWMDFLVSFLKFYSNLTNFWQSQVYSSHDLNYLKVYYKMQYLLLTEKKDQIKSL